MDCLVRSADSPKQIASGNPDYLKIHLAGLRQMIGLRRNFADVPPDVRFQISWSVIGKVFDGQPLTQTGRIYESPAWH